MRSRMTVDVEGIPYLFDFVEEQTSAEQSRSEPLASIVVGQWSLFRATQLSYHWSTVRTIEKAYNYHYNKLHNI